MKEAILYKKIVGGKVKCLNCAHYCIILPGKRGICGVRENINGKLYALNYKKLVALHIDPIEKKPFYHFLPGSYSLSMATVGCNFKCLNCCNADISQAPKPNKEVFGETVSPEEIVEIALENKLPSISYTYTEPTIFSEYALETMKIAKKKGLKNNWVTNGYWSKELFDLISPYLDAANVDLKFFSEKDYLKYSGGKLQPILDNLKRLKEKKIWVEITTLVIPTISDSPNLFEKIALFIKEELGTETPWHISQFSGAISWKLKHLPDTPLETLEKAIEIGKNVGLKYIYIGNVPGHKAENTYCPKCNQLVINRINYRIHRYDKEGKCPKCGENLNLILN